MKRGMIAGVFVMILILSFVHTVSAAPWEVEFIGPNTGQKSPECAPVYDDDGKFLWNACATASPCRPIQENFYVDCNEKTGECTGGCMYAASDSHTGCWLILTCTLNIKDATFKCERDVEKTPMVQFNPPVNNQANCLWEAGYKGEGKITKGSSGNIFSVGGSQVMFDNQRFISLGGTVSESNSGYSPLPDTRWEAKPSHRKGGECNIVPQCSGLYEGIADNPPLTQPSTPIETIGISEETEETEENGKPETNTGETPEDPSSCHDGEINGQESDIDCGIPCAKKCDVGQRCVGLNDCASGICKVTFSGLKCSSSSFFNTFIYRPLQNLLSFFGFESSSSSPSSTSNDDTQRSSSPKNVYSGSITFTADEVNSYPEYEGATGAVQHLSTTINFSDYQLGADGRSQSWEVPVSGIYNYSCTTTGNYVPTSKDSFPSKASYGGVLSTAPEPYMDASKGLENGVTLKFSSGAIADEPTTCAGNFGLHASSLINNVIHDIFSKYYGNTDKLASDSDPTYYFNKDGETVSFGRTFRGDRDSLTGSLSDWPDTITYNGTVTVIRDK